MSMPEWLEPMAATLTQDRFSGPEWLFERKFDGIRLLAYKQGDDVRLYSRDRLLQNLLEIAKPPFTKGKGLPRHAHWVRPEVVVQVGFIEWTVHGKLRHPRLLGVRSDKHPRDVIREQP